MDNKMLALKVYDVDYSFIIKNYLDEKLWEKEWTIFLYKKFKITLRLDSISVKSKSIWFEVMIDDNSEENKNYFTKRFVDSFKYALSIENINILKNTLNSTIFGLIKKMEYEAYICLTERYEELTDMSTEEQGRLREIAEEFLNSEGVLNDEIREAYIDYYVDKNERVYDLRNNYVEEMKYNILTDFYVAFLEATKDQERLEIIRTKIGQDALETAIEEIEEYKKYMESEDFERDMQDNLEEV